MDARQRAVEAGAVRELERVVARIRATGPRPIEPQPAPEVVAAVVVRAGAETPMARDEPAEWQRQWEAALVDMRAVELADALADGPL